MDYPEYHLTLAEVIAVTGFLMASGIIFWFGIIYLFASIKFGWKKIFRRDRN